MATRAVSDGYLDVSLDESEATEVVLAVQRAIRQHVPILDDAMGGAGFSRVHRLARMGHEAATERRLSSLDAEDAEILRAVASSADRLWFLWEALLLPAGSLRSSGDVVQLGDRSAKAVSEVVGS